jgi:probable addiction module antidote protein
MMTLQEVGLTEDDATTTPWNVLEYLTDEEEIKRYLQATILNINDGDCEPSQFFTALTDAAKARIINQLAKDTDIDRQTLCNIFLENSPESNQNAIDQDTVIKAAQSFSIPLPAFGTT